MGTPAAETRAAVEQVARGSYGRLVALLAARFHDLAAAEDAVAEALRAALETWPARGIPDRPEAWLMTTAKRAAGAARARSATAFRALPDLMLLSVEADDPATAIFPDHRLGLMFACTHPAIDQATQTPLMLQAVLGLTAERIASAFLMSPAAMGQRLSRAKTRLREAGATFSSPSPDEIEPHLPQVMEAILAAAALGWEAVPGSDPGRADLSTEALWLAEALAGLAIAEPEPQALLALLLYIQAREPSRRGRYTPLGEQDTSLWNRALIARADQLLSHASTHNRLGRFQCEAAIQSALCEGRLAGRTNWAALRVLHAALGRFAPSSGGAVAAAAVTLELDGPAAALAKLDALPGIKDFQPAWALRAEAEARAGNRTARDAALRRALGLAEDPALRAWLAERLTRP